jgi:hypothetical protein
MSRRFAGIAGLQCAPVPPSETLLPATEQNQSRSLRAKRL